MKDPKRIKPILKLLQEAWELVPDWRLGQLVSNLLGTGPRDVFHPEDETWEELLKEFIKSYKNN